MFIDDVSHIGNDFRLFQKGSRKDVNKKNLVKEETGMVINSIKCVDGKGFQSKNKMAQKKKSVMNEV